MQIKIEFNTDNAVFTDNENEIAVVLQRAASIIQEKSANYRGRRSSLEIFEQLRDTNGNAIGTVTVSP